MENNQIPKITQSMIDKNPNMSGTFYTEDRISLPKMKNLEIFYAYFFLKSGVLHNTLGPAVIIAHGKLVEFWENGKLVSNGSAPFSIEYSVPGEILNGQFVETKEGAEKHVYRDHNEKLHCVWGPAINDLKNPDRSSYIVHGKILSQPSWKKHPEVLEYFSKLNLKLKMKKNFGEAR